MTNYCDSKSEQQYKEWKMMENLWQILGGQICLIFKTASSTVINSNKMCPLMTKF